MTAGRGDRLARLLALVPWLIQHPGVTITEAADHFAVSPEQLEKDLWLVVCCGLPGHGPDQLIDIQFWDDEGRIDVIDPQSLVAPTHLTVDEAVSLQIGLSILARTAGPDDVELIHDTMNLLARATGGLEIPRIDPIHIESGTNDAVRAVLHTAGERGTPVRIDYYTATRDVVSRRVVWPRRIVVGGAGRLLLEAWCTQAQDARTFRVDRILQAEHVADDDTDAAGVPRPPAASTTERAPVTVTLKVSASARWVLDAYDLDVIDAPGGDETTARLEVHDPRWLTRLVLGLGGELIVTEPAAYRTHIAEAARRALTSTGEDFSAGRATDGGEG